MSHQPADPRALADELIVTMVGQSDSAEAIARVAVLLNRAATELHRRTRAGANERRGTDAWGTWAGLQNLARNLVLQSSTCRDSATALAERER